ELFAARALKRLVGRSLQGSSPQELGTMLRGPLGDPDLQVVFARDWRPPVEPGRDVTFVRQAGAPEVAIIHDPQLNDDPELREAAGALALLAAENAELEAGWREALRALERSRAR